MDSIIRFFFVLIFSVTTVISVANASMIETFDTQADMTNLVDTDVLSGDGWTSWYASLPFTTHTGIVLFDNSSTSNSISLIDDSLEILSFTYSEVLTTPGYSWDWNFYDTANDLIDTYSQTTQGQGSIYELDLAGLGLSGVNTIQLVSGSGYAAVDSLTYQTAVPVPAAVWLFGSGILCLITVARRKKN